MFVDVHPCSTLSLQHWAKPPQNDRVENVKLMVFCLRGETDKIRQVNIDYESTCQIWHRSV